MIRVAIYGKGGIGKSTTVSNLSVTFARMGLKVLQIGCDPKADSTIALHGSKPMQTVLQVLRAKGKDATLDDMVTVGTEGVLCVEAGGPMPGVGCAGRGIIAALEALRDRGVFDDGTTDVVLYDVLGDVVCGGFAMPIRDGYAEHVAVVTSGEAMALYAAANISAAVEHFADRGYARLAGLILNRRNVPREDERVAEMARELHTEIIGDLDFNPLVQQAEQQKRTVMELFPKSELAGRYRALANKLLTIARGEWP